MKHKVHDKYKLRLLKSLLYWKDEWPWLYSNIKSKVIRPS